MSQSDSSDPFLKLELRNRDIEKNETDSDLRVHVLHGWPLQKIKQISLKPTAPDLSSESNMSLRQVTIDTENDFPESMKNSATNWEDEFQARTDEAESIFKRKKRQMENELQDLKECISTMKLSQQDSRPQLSISGVSDTTIAPKAFTGKHAENDAESWLEYFERYCSHRRLPEHEKLTLFGLMMREGAADWLSTLPGESLDDYSHLRRAFKDNYFRPEELRWRETGLLWSQSQKEDEKVEDFVTRMRKGAKRLDMEPKSLCDAVLNGLRPQIRMFVLQQKIETLDDLIRAAKIAEAVAPTNIGDSMSTLLVQAMKASTEANKKQAEEIRELTSKFTALTHHREKVEMIRTPNQTPKGRFNYTQTPQNRQRFNYARNFGDHPAQPAFRRPQQKEEDYNWQQRQNACMRCGYTHAAGNCRAIGQRCNFCQKVGHFAKTCLAARQNQN